ncbi:hypothetical protein HYS50_03820 [Candidatus Woesearchaeota archaeon]|nr:hypothetical protein [Candidatus Woesearchaeota archaeon]
MTEIEIISEKSLTLGEVKDMVAEIKKNTELGFRANKTMEYVELFAKQKSSEITEMKKKIEELNIIRLKEKVIAKIIDLQPTDTESLKMVLTTENITVKQEDLGKILECLK